MVQVAYVAAHLMMAPCDRMDMQQRAARLMAPTEQLYGRLGLFVGSIRVLDGRVNLDGGLVLEPAPNHREVGLLPRCRWTFGRFPPSKPLAVRLVRDRN